MKKIIILIVAILVFIMIAYFFFQTEGDPIDITIEEKEEILEENELEESQEYLDM